MSPYGTQRRSNTNAEPKDQSHLLPIHLNLPKTCQSVIIDRIQSEEEIGQVHSILNKVLAKGQTYPQYGPMDRHQFMDYYLSHDAYCAKLVDGTAGPSKVIGSVYCKPNFPGRSAHICNGGFLVHEEYRGRGVGGLLADAFEILARDLGYQAAFFNLVFVTNQASLRLWRSRGYREIGRIPEAADLKDFGMTDAVQFYKRF